MQDLKTIVELSHEFGTPEYVKGGGGNTSYKDESTLWVKPSGTTLAGLQEDTFVTLNRAKVNELYDVCLLYTSPSPRDGLLSRMPSSA